MQPPTSIMDSNILGATDFSFAFNNPKFSDRVLSIEIMADPVEIQLDGTAHLSTQNHKLSRDGVIINQETGDGTSLTVGDRDSMGSVNQNMDTDATIEESSSGGEATRRHDASRSRELSTVLRVTTMHINSAILAAKSSFFYKLFSNGMVESEQHVATLRIHASEEAVVVELLKFMYGSNLSMVTPSSLLHVLLAADKFEVASCMQYCIQLLRKLPMTCDFALRCLDLPSCLLNSDALQQLTDLAKQFIAVYFRDIEKFENQVLNLPLAGIEALLASNGIRVPSEDVVYDFVIKWAERHYPQLEERREILETRLCHLIRFPYMTSRKFEQVITGTNFSPEVASKIVFQALLSKTEAPYRHVASKTAHHFVKRAYEYFPVKSVGVELPHCHCVVYLDIKWEDCVCLFPVGCRHSEAFYLCGQNFCLTAQCNIDDRNESQCFGLALRMLETGSGSVEVEYEFAAWSKEDGYMTEYKSSFTLAQGKSVERKNLFQTTWEEFIAEDSPFFINGILHLRAEVTIKQ